MPERLFQQTCPLGYESLLLASALLRYKGFQIFYFRPGEWHALLPFVTSGYH